MSATLVMRSVKWRNLLGMNCSLWGDVINCSKLVGPLKPRSYSQKTHKMAVSKGRYPKSFNIFLDLALMAFKDLYRELAYQTLPGSKKPTVVMVLFRYRKKPTIFG